MEWLEQYGAIAVLALLVIAIIQFIMLLTTQGKLRKLSKKYSAMMNGQGINNLEDLIVSIQQKLDNNGTAISEHTEQIRVLQKQKPLDKNKIAIHRYNAFSNVGSDLSFSVAIVNEEKDGIVLTSIHSRDGGYMYGKPVEKGQSKYSLTPEEMKVIEEAK